MKPSSRKKTLQKKKPAVGILGGIFNPIHNGHCATACLARDFFGLRKVYLVPSGIPPHKYNEGIASADDRLAMTELAVKMSAGLSVWDGEIRRGGVSYSIDTIRAISARHQSWRLFFIIGSDNLPEISTWHCYKDILASVTLCVAHRPGHTLAAPPELAGADIREFPSPEWAISSTMIREYLLKGYSCEHLLPVGVERYIKKHGLYKR
ncbi:MAG TPA: nicotinate-nucleotide adenylyltransferase [Chitinivibrionales bacterium]|nr:nicotinate-nucleotide adenylyltransferase [Chitinivibrionales bacterium]